MKRRTGPRTPLGAERADVLVCGASFAGLAVARELAGTGVHVGVVSPGPIDTEMAPGADEYKGKLYPASLVAGAIVAGVEKERVHQTAPRKFGAASAMYPIMGGPFRWGIRKFTAGAEPREAHH